MTEGTKKKAPPKLVNVRVVEVSGHTSLVEFIMNEKINRGFIPSEVIVDGQAPEDELGAMIQFGVPWERVLQFDVTTEDFANALRAHGIWSYDDARNKPNLVISALQSVYRLDLGAVLSAAKNFERS
jgi:hypothetical protein